MSLALITAPLAEPVSLAEARAYLRIGDSEDTQTDEDTLISELIAAADDYVERLTARSFVRATWEISLRDWPGDNLIRLPRSPLSSVTSVKYRNAAGTTITLTETTDFLVDSSAEPGTIEPVSSWPRTGDFFDAVVVRFIAGYAPGVGSPVDHAENVPQMGKIAIKGLVSHWFDTRGCISDVGWHEAPHNVIRLVTSLRVWGSG